MLTVPESAVRTKLSRETIRLAIRRGQLKAGKIGNKYYYIDETDLDAWNAARRPVGNPNFVKTP